MMFLTHGKILIKLKELHGEIVTIYDLRYRINSCLWLDRDLS